MRIELEAADIAPEVRRWISEQTRELLGEPDWVSLKFSARDEAGELVGGATGAINHGVLHVQLLATAPTHRRRGLGALLLRALEAHAARNGATCALVDTLEFEAPDFYQKQGYTILGVVGDQVGRRKFFLSKKLEASPTATR